MIPKRYRESAGVVLLSVLLIVALLSALAVRMTSRHALIVAQLSQVSGSDVTLNYALGAEAFARQILWEDLEQQAEGELVDHLGEGWAQPLQPFELNEFEDAFIEMQIRDMHSCFNLNSLAGGGAADSSEAGASFERLQNMLRALGLTPNIAMLWKDWVDADQEPTGAGAEDGDYLLEEIPYRTANGQAGDVSELYLLRGVDPRELEAILPFVCVLPTEDLQINVNTAPAEVLAALNGEQGLQAFAEVVNQERRFSDTGEATSAHDVLLPGNDVLRVDSEYFEVRARVQIGDNLTEISSLLHRDTAAGRIRTIRRDFGRNFVSLYQEDADET
ncbi:MAG: type II secretion system minor pseudopilin GspK [Pseudomonadota bacterium]